VNEKRAEFVSCRKACSAAAQRPSVVTFAFGLVHGFGVSFALRETLHVYERI